jgi:hypothetical protein
MAQALLHASVAVAAQIRLPSVSKASNSIGNIIPNRYIIEVDALFRIANNRLSLG